eukprot:4851793-Prymnesium_polylepis.1
MGDGGIIVCGFMVHCEGCAHQVEARERARLLGSSQAIGSGAPLAAGGSSGHAAAPVQRCGLPLPQR